MKYLSLFILLMFVSLSWNLIHKPSAVNEEIHTGLQEDLKKFITEYIEENAVSITDLKFEKMWTETLKPNQVKASFRYSFDQGGLSDSRTMIEGYAILNKAAKQDREYEVWNFDDLYILDNHVEFSEGIEVRPTFEN